MRDVAVAAGHRLGGHEGVDDGLLSGLDRGPEERADPGVIERPEVADQRSALRVVHSSQAPIARGEGKEQVSAGVLAGTTGARYPQASPLREPLALVRQQGRIRGEHDDDRARVAVADAPA